MTDDEALVSRRFCGVDVRSGPPQRWVAELDDAQDRGRVSLGYVNTYTAFLLARDEGYRAALQSFVLLNDGIGLDLVGLIKYNQRFRYNLNGSDFTPLYLRDTRHRHRVYLLGGRPGVAERAAEALAGIAPQHEYVGAHHGFFNESDAGRIISDINASGASLVLVALGNPRQEMWIAEHVDKLDAKMAAGVGALFDFLAGHIARAPRWVQNLKLEWLFRLAKEPRRLWKRYIVYTPVIMVRAVKERSGVGAEIRALAK